MIESLRGHIWLYRGVPEESDEVAEVVNFGELRPLRPDRRGDLWRQYHSAGATETGYTSWSTDRSIAEAAAHACSEGEGLSGRIRVFRVRIESLEPERVFEGRADEDEFLIEGTVGDVEISDDATDEQDE